MVRRIGRGRTSTNPTNRSNGDADLLLQVRCAGFNGKLGSNFGQLFQVVDPASELAMAA